MLVCTHLRKLGPVSIFKFKNSSFVPISRKIVDKQLIYNAETCIKLPYDDVAQLLGESLCSSLKPEPKTLAFFQDSDFSDYVYGIGKVELVCSTPQNKWNCICTKGKNLEFMF